MNTLRNSVRLVGNLGMDPEVREFDNGKKMARVSVATNETYRNEAGEKITETQWHTLIFWGQQARLAEQFLKKGDEIAVEGKLHNRNYVDKDGIKRYVTEILVNDFMRVGLKKEVA